jgi:hypothetical protein
MAPSSLSDAASPFSDASAPIRLHVSVGSPLAEVFLIDHKFALIDRAVGDLDARVEPAVYTVRARLGDKVVERPVVLFADTSLDLRGELRVSSPAPLEGTLLTHEWQVDHAASGSGTNNWKGQTPETALSKGSGAEVFLMTRRWSAKEQPQDPQAAALSTATAPELSLLRSDGELILDLANAGTGRKQGFDPYLGRRVAVDPGAYILRWRPSAHVSAEQSVQAVRGWQTQVFLLEDASGAAEADRRQVSILMTRPGEFHPTDPVLHQVEEARLALADERKVASERVDQLLFAKFENPMLGLFGAHLMLICRDALKKDRERQLRGDKRIPAPVRFNQDLFDRVVHNLSSLVGPDHPDVAALSTQTTGRRLDALAPVTTPPMLWRSWLLLIEASHDRSELVPVATWRRAIRLLPLRPFLVWSPEKHEALDEAWDREVRGLLAASAPPRQTVHHLLGAEAASRDAPFGPSSDEVRRSLSLQVLAPRAVIDELAAMPKLDSEEGR